MQNLTGKVAFITGGASGMGLAMARSFSAAGMKVVVADVEQQALDAVSAEFAQQSNAELLALRVDVTDRQAMAKAADAVEARFGKVHVLVNNAGVAVGGTLDSMSYADWDWVTGVNLDGVVNGLQVFIERIKRHGEGGHIVNTASMAGHLAIPSLGVYNATKWAVVGISETLHTELAPHNIGVSVLCPGLVATNIFDSQRNRPDGLQAEQGSDTSLTAITEEAQAAMQTALDPAVVGEMVLTAIQENDLYVFTHPEFKEHVLTRYQAVGEAFDRWEAYRQDITK